MKIPASRAARASPRTAARTGETAGPGIVTASAVVRLARKSSWDCPYRKRYFAVQSVYHEYRVTHRVVTNLPLTSTQKFHFGLACPGLARPKQYFCVDVSGRFVTT